MSEYCKPYVSRPTEGQVVLWTNPKMLECSYPGCHFVDTDPDDMTAHYVSVHGKPAEPEAMKDQGKLMGGKVELQDRIAVILESLPKEEFMCPFCFCRQSSTATRIFNPEGKLLKKVRCFECHKEMMIDTMRWTRDPKKFGREVGAYPGWWKKVEHDSWMQKLKAFYPPAGTGQFWEGYGQSRPEWKAKQDEKRRLEQAGGDVALAEQRRRAEEKKRDDDEMAPYRRKDGSIDWDLLARDTKKEMQKNLENP